jgi:hypothetical protein
LVEFELSVGTFDAVINPLCQIMVCSMSKGWKIEARTEHMARSGQMVKLQMFDVAIEDKAGALQAVWHHLEGTAVTQIVAKEELSANNRLSPGRVKLRTPIAA